MAKENKSQGEFLFEKRNYFIMIIGIAIILLGFGLMIGGGSEDPEVFNAEMYNFRRIRLAPTLVLIGLAIQIYAIFAKSKNKS